MPKLMFLIPLLFFISCDQQQINNGHLGVWTSLQSDSLGRLVVTVRLEDSSGNIPTGARVLVRTPDNEVSWLTFISDNNIYKTYIENSVSGDFRIEVKSVIQNVDQIVPYYYITTAPTLKNMVDGEGADILSNQNLNPSKKISVTWDRVEGATVYKGIIKSGSSIVKIFSTSEDSYLLDSGTLEAGTSYLLELEAQAIIGDPYFNSEDFYSYSSKVSSEYAFSTK